MAFLVALALAIFVLPSPWGIVAVAAGGVVEVAEATFLWRLSHRRPPAVGVEALVGAEGIAATSCRPLGQVRVRGELWQARCAEGVGAGEAVRVAAVQGLVLVVEAA